MNPYSVTFICFAFGVLLVAVLALTKRKDKIALRFLMFSIAIFGWGFIEAFWFSQNYSQQTCLAIMRVSNAFAIWIPITWFHFVLSFIEQKEPVRFFYGINYTIAFGLTLFSQSPLFISGTHAILYFKYYTSPGPLFHIFALNFFTIVPFGFIYLMKAYRLNDVRRVQLRCVVIATISGFAAGSSVFFPVYKLPVPLYFLPLMVIYPLFMGLALIKYGLFDTQQIADVFQREKITALGIMAASLNHEMRNPLYIAKGRIEGYRAIQEREGLAVPVEKTNEIIDSVFNQLDRTLDIMQRFSDFSTPFNAQKDKQIFTLEGLIHDVLELVSYALRSEKIEVEKDVETGLEIYGNRRQMEEVLVNLITNASQAIKAGAGTGRIGIRAKSFKDKLTIQIVDDGPGMNPEQAARVFEPFYTTKEKGTGLGLYITKQLVEKNGGKIAVKSKTGQGSAFIIYMGSSRPAKV